MKSHVKIPQGCFVVEVQDAAAWLSIKFGFHMRSIPFKERPFDDRMSKDHDVISEADLLLIGSTDPENPARMGEVMGLLGLMP